MPVCKRYFVSGRVQGVFYRASTRDMAVRLGVRGYVRNLADGRVEVMACGDETTLQALQDWLHQGPDLARVEAVECEVIADRPSFDGFSVR